MPPTESVLSEKTAKSSDASIEMHSTESKVARIIETCGGTTAIDKKSVETTDPLSHVEFVGGRIHLSHLMRVFLR